MILLLFVVVCRFSEAGKLYVGGPFVRIKLSFMHHFNNYIVGSTSVVANLVVPVPVVLFIIYTYSQHCITVREPNCK